MQGELDQKPHAQEADTGDFDMWLPSLTDKTNSLLALRDMLAKFARADEGGLLGNVNKLSDFYEERERSRIAVTEFLALIEIRFDGYAPVADFIGRAKALIAKVTENIDNLLLEVSEQYLSASIKDIIDEPFGRLLEIQSKYRHIFTRDIFLQVLMTFIQSKQESGLRDSVQMINFEQSPSVADRYKTVVLKLKRNNFMYSVLKGRMSNYVKNFRTSLNMEALQAVPLQILNNVESSGMGNFSIMPDLRQHFSSMRESDPNYASSNMLANKNNMSELFQPVQRDKDETTKEEFFPINIRLLKAYATENEVSSFARISNLLLYQILAKTSGAIELYSLEEVLVHGIMEYLKVLKLPESQKVLLQNNSLKRLIVRQLTILMYTIGKSILGRLSNDNEIGMYSVVSKLFIVEIKLKEVFTDSRDLIQFHSTKVNGVFAFSLKRFVNTIRDKSAYFYDLYIKDNLDNFKKLDLFNKALNERLSEGLPSSLKDGTFYQQYNQVVNQNGFFDSQTAKQHYMVPFHFILHRVGIKNKGALIWAVKAAVYELFHCLTKKKHFINFYGYLSLILNLNAFLHELTLTMDANFKTQVGCIGELRFLKHFFFKLLKGEIQTDTTKKASSVHAAYKRIKISYDIIDSLEGINYTQFIETKANKLDLPREFDEEDFYDQIALNVIVR
jgi:hypothetical protein